MASATASFQQLVAGAGALPITEGLMLAKLMRLCLPGLGDLQYSECDAELNQYLAVEHLDGPSRPITPGSSAH